MDKPERTLPEMSKDLLRLARENLDDAKRRSVKSRRRDRWDAWRLGITAFFVIVYAVGQAVIIYCESKQIGMHR